MQFTVKEVALNFFSFFHGCAVSYEYLFGFISSVSQGTLGVAEKLQDRRGRNAKTREK